MMREFVIGDIHGRYDALIEVLFKSQFNRDKDKLIILGDVCDCGKDTYKVVEELLKIKNKVYLKGNHDDWFLNYINTGELEPWWLVWGGYNTLKSYGVTCPDKVYLHGVSILNFDNLVIPQSHIDFFSSGALWYIEETVEETTDKKQSVFVHGGFVPPKDYSEDMDSFDFLHSQTKNTCIYDKTMVGYAKLSKLPYFDRVFVGHTTTTSVAGVMHPVKYHNLIMMDCGAGWDGRLAIMDIDSEEYWLSEKQELMGRPDGEQQ